ncbi:hypothetical protein H760_YJM456O00006 [Saccharomyces cerevisiae YJM456]|nr:hypothetical protein H760_YJM456O00006 [Saccharomyces cerevisiae YJM456]AJT80124.1 hypothetical protein H766_YJM681O00007 [Saccharomyces cerevisiae YJM681]AJT88955.1 hypothetical protein H783_YJM1199O00007 [Saccharomyces cerevisiae YJM1199]AJT89448.1 hypothetical protein H784_YJM1202O00007 [Saccharomyces cerevisiae YJM1202]
MFYASFNKCVSGYSSRMAIHYYVYRIIKSATRPDYKSNTQTIVL